ncbi:hypothetical protein [Methanobrevibacter sp.]
MNDIFTVEDVNSALLKYSDIPFWDKVEINTGNDESDFTGFNFDYLTVNRRKNFIDNTPYYEFEITVKNDLIGVEIEDNIYGSVVFYVTDANNNWTDSYFVAENKKIYVTSNTYNINLHLNILNNTNLFTPNTPVPFLIEDFTPKVTFNDEVEVTLQIRFLNPSFGPLQNEFVIIDDMENEYIVTCINDEITVNLQLHTGMNRFLLLYDYQEHYLQFNINRVKNINLIKEPEQLIVGAVNNFVLDSESSNVIVESDYPVTVDGLNVSLDLTGKNDLKPVLLKVRTLMDTEFYPNEYNFKVNVDYPTIHTIGEFETAIENGSIIRLGVNLTLNKQLTIDNLYIYGNEHQINCNGFNFIINGEFKAEDLSFVNGVNTLLQKTGSNVTLNNCNFTGCMVGDVNLGSCILCDTDIASLTVSDDYKTNLFDCRFENNESCILHGGELIVDGCTGVNNGHIGYPQFLYQTDGGCSITNSDFIFNHDTVFDTDILYLACLVEIGENASINGATIDDLSINDSLPFFDNVHGNTSKVNVTYYYPPIEDYVTLENSVNNRSVCHAVSTVDYVFKNNVTIRRA